MDEEKNIEERMLQFLMRNITLKLEKGAVFPAEIAGGVKYEG